MPIYEFKCNSCKNKKEIIQKTTETGFNFCDQCNETTPMKQIVSTSSFHLKGECWYKDGYISQKPVETKNKIKN